MTALEKQRLLDLQGFDDLDGGFQEYEDLNEVLEGDEAVKISHEGHELSDLVHDIATAKTSSRRKDSRTRRDRTQNRVDMFSQVLEPLVDAFLGWKAKKREQNWQDITAAVPEGIKNGTYGLTLVDMFGALAILFSSTGPHHCQ